MNNIPLIDIKRQYLKIKKEIDTAIFDVINNTAFIGNKSNKYVKEFEEKFAEYNNVRFCIGCANGTDSLEIALKAVGVSYGDEVIAPAFSWISTSEAVSNIGAVPVFVDIEEKTYTIDTKKLGEKISEKTKAIIPVHLYGHPANMPEILEIAEKYNLFIIEDCAQAHGAEINGRKAGTFGHFGSFSFFPGKNLGAFGDAGGLITNDPQLAEKALMIAQHGMKEIKHVHYIEGRNSRLDGIQAAILSIKLKYLADWTIKRIQIASFYTKNIVSDTINLPEVNNGFKHVYHLFVIKIKKRDDLSKYLNDQGIGNAVMYPTPLPFQKAYKQRKYLESDFPVASSVTTKILAIPMFPELKHDELNRICEALNAFN